ncbi:MAG: HAMP domain-containing sensor histidine kinase [Polyangiales bacterium]
MNLATRMVLSLLVPVLVCLGAYGVLNVRLRRVEMVDDARRELNDYSKVLSVALGAALRDRQIGDVAELVDDLSQADRVFGVVIFDDRDRVVRASQAVAGDVQRFLAVGRAARTGDSSVQSLVVGRRPVMVYGFALRVRDHDEPSGSAVLLRDLSYVEQNIATAARRVALVGLALALSVVVAAWLGMRSSVLHPLALVLGAVERTGPESLEHKAPVVRNDEIGRLAIAFNSLLDSLRQAQRSLEERTQTLVAVERRLHHAQRLAVVGQLAANLAHKVGSPLNVILGRARYALQHGGQSERDQRHLREIIAGAENISAVIEQLLAHARKGRGPLADVRLDEVAQSVARFLEIEAAKRGVTVTVDAPVAVTVQASREEIEQVVLNLMMNALQAQPSGGRVALTVTAPSGAAMPAQIVVDDAGPGLGDGDPARVFEPFYTTKPASEGTGLGLTICDEIARRLGGSITAEASEMGGARFVVNLPHAHQELQPEASR